MNYIDRVKELANNLSWANQVRIENLQKPSLSYTLLKNEIKDTMNAVLVDKTSQVPYVNNSNHTYSL